MVFRRVKLEVESLEKREVLSASVSTLILPAVTSSAAAISSAATSTTTTPTVPPIDTTTTPANPANAVVTAQVTALGPIIGNTVSSITVSGLPQSLPPSSVLSVTIGGNTYLVTQATSQANGLTTLTVSGGIDPTTVQVGSTVTVTFGTGGNVAPPASPVPAPPTAPPTPPPVVSPIDPTLLPAS